MEGEAGECALPHIACLGVHTLRLQLCLRQMYAVQLIKALEAARGNGTSMISLIMPPKGSGEACDCYTMDYSSGQAGASK